MKSKIALKILSLLGFSTAVASCEIVIEWGGGGAVCMYGTPSADYVFNVDVKDVENNAPIEGIRVSVIQRYLTNSVPTQIDTLTHSLTDNEGKVTLSLNTWPESSFEIAADDIDGAENGGEFSTASTTIAIDNKDYKNPGEHGWYRGTATKNATIKLSKKE